MSRSPELLRSGIFIDQHLNRVHDMDRFAQRGSGLEHHDDIVNNIIMMLHFKQGMSENLQVGNAVAGQVIGAVKRSMESGFLCDPSDFFRVGRDNSPINSSKFFDKVTDPCNQVQDKPRGYAAR